MAKNTKSWQISSKHDRRHRLRSLFAELHKKMNKAFMVAMMAAYTNALENGLGLSPQMGWNTWNKFGCNISEQLIKDSVDTIIVLGLN